MHIVTKNDLGYIEEATSDDGRMSYTTFHDSIVTIDGRECWRSHYLGDDGRVTAEKALDIDWIEARNLARDVDRFNNTLRKQYAAQRDAAMASRMTLLGCGTKNLIGFDDHPDND